MGEKNKKERKTLEIAIVKKCPEEDKLENNGTIEHGRYRQERDILNWFGIGLTESTKEAKIAVA